MKPITTQQYLCPTGEIRAGNPVYIGGDIQVVGEPRQPTRIELHTDSGVVVLDQFLPYSPDTAPANVEPLNVQFVK